MIFEELVFWGYISVAISFFTFVLGLAKRSWISMLISSVTSLPLVFYFLGYPIAEMKLIWLVPFLLVILAFWMKTKSRAA